MKALFSKRTWFKITSILVVATFVFQANTYAGPLSYSRYEIVHDDFKEGAVGFVITVAIPFVPVVAEGIGTAVGLSEAGTKILGAVMGAGLGATPGIIAEDGTATTIGAITGGISGYYNTSNYISVMNSNPTILPMEQYATNLSLALNTQAVSSTLTQTAVLCWEWDPEWAQALGMIGGSVTGWTMGSATSAGQEMMKDMYQDINPKWADAPRKAGLVTGLGLGSIQAGIYIGLNKVLEDADMPDSAKYSLASMGSNALGSLVWGGIAGGFGETAVKADLEATINNLDTPDKIKQAQQLRLDDYNKYGGTLMGMKSVANEQFYNSLVRQGLSIGISWAAEESKMWANEEQEVRERYASILGVSGSMLLANLPIWLQGPQRNEAKELRDRAGDLQTTANSLKEQAKDFREGYPEDLAKLALADTWITQADAMDTRANRNISEANWLNRWHFNSLREATPITSIEPLDMFLEPLIYYGASVAMADSSKGKTGVELTAHNLAAMNLASLTHAGIVALVNKQGWDEFGQVYMLKTREFQGDLFSFGSRAFGAKTSRRREEAVGAANIYGATQRNSQMWSFAGLSGFTIQADKIRKEGGDWRQLALGIPSGFAVMGAHAGGLARYHTVRNLEGLTYTASKTLLWPYNLFRFDRDLAEDLKANNPKLFEEINRWIKKSSYPAYSPSPAKIRFPSWSIGRNPVTGELILENTVTERTYPLTLKELQKHNVNRPFEYEPRTKIPITQPPTYIFEVIRTISIKGHR